MTLENQNLLIYWKRNERKSLYQTISVILEATGTEKLQGKQNLRYLKKYCYKKIYKMIKNNKKLQAKLCSGVPNIHMETEFSNVAQE